MEGEWKESERKEIITMDLNYHLQTRELAAQREKKKNQNNTNPQTLQTNPPKITKSTKYQEKTIYAYLNRSTPKIESQSHDVSLKIHF